MANVTTDSDTCEVARKGGVVSMIGSEHDDGPEARLLVPEYARNLLVVA